MVIWLGGPGECFVGCADLIETIIIHLLSLDLYPRSLFPPSSSPYTIPLFAHFLDTISYLFVRSHIPCPLPLFVHTHSCSLSSPLRLLSVY